jgi:hypothetical protein
VTPGLRAVVTLADGRTLIREAYAGSSYLAGEDPRLHFGLGSADSVAKLEILLPDGTRTMLEDVAADRVIRIGQIEN